jgi:hypothetical protein
MWKSRKERRLLPPPSPGTYMPIQIDITVGRPQVLGFHEIMLIKAVGTTAFLFVYWFHAVDMF